ncbi:Biotin transporter BioY [bacterium HR17]|uniref:Biotin transporter n=1 Tax=Candidatus Fervidibacter japonicus TaxID=2035412 RepID=A0A2H5XDX3_9BACT|nr:Biotin transporter BioY [bacterium HR17]
MTVVSAWLRQRSLTERIVALAVANLLLITSAQIRIPLPFTPVPITGQTFGVLLLGAVLGSRYGTAVVTAYVLEGLVGLPVFAGWRGGWSSLLGPTGGYIVGFIPAAFVAGWLMERGGDRRFATALGALLLANAVIYAIGLPWLAAFVGADKVVAMGLLPFVPGDLIKAVAAASSVVALRRVA